MLLTEGVNFYQEEVFNPSNPPSWELLLLKYY
jgi:hypothetical protein